MPPKPQWSPSQVLVTSLAGLIAAGTLLLWLPLSAGRGSLSLLNAFFTATSAVCVTGLTVVDTPVDLSPFGQAVLLLLIQAGGLGYMSLTTIMAVAIGRSLTIQERLTLQEALNVESMEGLIRFTMGIFRLTLVFELAGAVVLGLWWASDMGPGRAAWFGLFHAVSAFNNAGFSLFPDNLISQRGDWVVNLVVCALVIVGGIGFVVLTELGRRHRVVKLSLHTKLALAMTAILIVSGTIAIYVLESGNARTLAPLGMGERWLVSFFHAVSSRTAGFNTLDIGTMTQPALFVLLALMFIGAAPGGTGGGVKVTTFGITVVALWATVRGKAEPTVFRRRLPNALVARAFFICLMGFLVLNGVAGLLLITDGRLLLPTLFETTSAFGTVGLSMGQSGSVLSLAGHLSGPGKLLLAGMMFLGRIGPLTVAVALARRREPPRLRYAEGKVLVG
jgi:trk system potassium uptake protein TrkH